MAAIAGFGGRIIINGTVLRAYHWSIDFKVDDFDVTTFENFGFGQYLAGIEDVDVSFDAYFDTTDNPFAGPLLLQPGVTVTNVIIRYNKVLADFAWSIPSLLITNVHSETGVRDVVRYTVTGKASTFSSTVPTPPVQ